MEPDFRELGHKEICLCGSGRKYGKCCAKKDFAFGTNADGDFVKRLPARHEVGNALEEVGNRFEELYGRPQSDRERVFGHMVSPAEGVNTFTRLLLRAGLPPDIAYAYCRTDGILPVEGNLGAVADVDVAEFTFYRNEYESLMAAPEADDGATALWFVAAGNTLIADVVDGSLRKIELVLTDFLSRHSDLGGFVDFELATPIDYGKFSAFKTSKTLRTIERLRDEGMPEAIYALSRGLLENYLHLNAIAADANYFAAKVRPRADRQNFEFATKNGRINYNRVVHRETGEVTDVWVETRGLLRHATDLDRELFDLFYQTACQFVHVDVLSARAYFYDADPFDELDPALLAALVSTVLAGRLVAGLASLPDVQMAYRQDVEHFLGMLCEDLRTALQVADADPEHRNDVWPVLQRVVETWARA